MRKLFPSYWLAIRRWPLYAGLAALGLAVFAWAGLSGHRLLGDANESSDTELAGPPRASDHGGAGHFYHK